MSLRPVCITVCMTYRFVLPVSPISKKNNRPIYKNRKTGIAFLGKNKRLSDFENVLHLLITSQKNRYGIQQPLDNFLKIDFRFEMKKTLRLDADNAMQGVLDALQESGVILNDNQFKSGSWLVVENTGNPDKIIVEISNHSIPPS